MKRLIKFMMILMLCFCSLSIVSAKTFDHFYAKADDDIVFDDSVNGSSALAGDSLTSKSKVNGVNFLAGNRVEHTGESDYLVVAGNSVFVGGVVLNDVVVAGNVVSLNDEADLQRDAIILGADVEIKGILNRDVVVYGSRVTIKRANIGGNVRIYAEDIIIDDDTVIKGMLYYPKNAETSISSKITNITKTDSLEREDDDFLVMLISKLWSFMSIILIFAVLTLLIPSMFEKINNRYGQISFNKGTEMLAKGLIFLIVIPVIALILLIIPFGVPLSLIMLVLYIMLIYLSKVFAGYLLGYKLWQKLFNKDINILLVGVLGFLLLFILDLIPGIRIIVSIFTLLFGIGIIYELLLNKNNE